MFMDESSFSKLIVDASKKRKKNMETCEGCGCQVPTANKLVHSLRCRSMMKKDNLRDSDSVESKNLWQDHLQMIADSDRVLALDIEKGEQEEEDEALARELMRLDAEEAHSSSGCTVVVPPRRLGSVAWNEEPCHVRIHKENKLTGKEILSRLLINPSPVEKSFVEEEDSPNEKDDWDSLTKEMNRVVEMQGPEVDQLVNAGWGTPRCEKRAKRSGLALAGIGILSSPTKQLEDQLIMRAIEQSIVQQ